MSIILHPCVESHFVETSTLLKLKLSNNDKCDQPDTKNISKNNDFGDWSFLKALSNINSSCPNETLDKQNVYVHPLSKKSATSRLSEKSLQLCTENLGSETGTDIIDCRSFIQSYERDCMTIGSEKSSDPIVIPPANQYRGWNTMTHSSMVRSSYDDKTTKNSCRKFPPPLTTISGRNSVQVKPHREGGRLVIKAVDTPTKPTNFQAERSHGRLRLCFLNDESDDFQSQVWPDENEVVTENENDSNHEEVPEMNEEFRYEEDDHDDEICDHMNREMKVEIGKEKFQSIGRCNEVEHSNKGFCNWEPFWVATS